MTPVDWAALWRDAAARVVAHAAAIFRRSPTRWQAPAGSGSQDHARPRSPSGSPDPAARPGLPGTGERFVRRFIAERRLPYVKLD